jgi:hypothetical protein
MKRFFDIESDGTPIMDVDVDNDLVNNMKSAAYYLDAKTKHLSDSEFMSWLQERQLTGFNDSDIADLQNANNDPKLKHFLTIMGFPLFCSSIIKTCAAMNNLNDIDKENKDIKKWL